MAENIEKKHVRNWIYLGIFTVILFLVIVFFALFNNRDQSEQPNNNFIEENFDEVQNFEILPLEDTAKISGNNITLTLPNPYKVTTVAKGSAPGFQCKGFTGTECTVFFVSEGEDSTLEYFFSTLNYQVLDLEFETSLENKEVDLGNTKLQLTYEKVVLEDDNDKRQESNLVSQIYGCLENKICVNAGFLSEVDSENKKQVEKFEQFLKNITVN